MNPEQTKQIFSDASLYSRTCENIDCIETHISWVFLTGDYAYKVKKAVDFGFLDFSTLAKRKRFCQFELERNKVFAPDLYIQVLGLHKSGDQYELTQQLEDALEYVVEMRQFSQADLLSQQLQQQRISVSSAHPIGLYLAQLHQRLETAPEDTDWGKADKVSEPVLDNFKLIAPLLESGAESKLLEKIKSWTMQQIDLFKPLFERRRQQGFIKSCHGDLHLNNLLWLNQRLVPFDCIEFNEEFRWIDTVNELAFLLMDLQYNDYHEMAAHCLNGYLQESGDFEAMALLDFYQVYRALVRAKVALLRATQMQAKDQQQCAKTEARCYLQLAETIAFEKSPQLYMTYGISGSGKSTLTRALAGRIGAIHVRADVERKRLFNIKAHESSDSRLDAGIYTAEASEKTFEHLHLVTGNLLRQGFTVIVDSTFLHKKRRQPFQALADSLGVPFGILHCDLDPAIAAQRIQARQASGGDPSEADLKVLEQQLLDREPLSLQEKRFSIQLDMQRPVDNLLAELTRLEHSVL